MWLGSSENTSVNTIKYHYPGIAVVVNFIVVLYYRDRNVPVLVVWKLKVYYRSTAFRFLFRNINMSVRTTNAHHGYVRVRIGSPDPQLDVPKEKSERCRL